MVVIFSDPIAFVSFGDLANVSYRLKEWAGASLLIVTTPICVAYICLNLSVKGKD